MGLQGSGIKREASKARSEIRRPEYLGALFFRVRCCASYYEKPPNACCDIKAPLTAHHSLELGASRFLGLWGSSVQNHGTLIHKVLSNCMFGSLKSSLYRFRVGTHPPNPFPIIQA